MDHASHPLKPMETGTATSPITESLSQWTEPACLVNGEGRVLLASAGFGELAGQAVESLSGLDPELLLQSIDGGEPATWQAELVDPEGTRMDLLVVESKRDQLTASGRTVRSPGTDLDRLNAIGEVVPTLFHDLNNMLGSISGISELAAMKLPEGDPMQERLNRVVDTVIRASALSRQVSLLVRTPPEKTPLVDLVDLIDEAMVLARSYLNRGIALETSWPETRLATDLHPSSLRHLVVEIILAAGIVLDETGGSVQWTLAHGERETTGRPTVLLTVTARRSPEPAGDKEPGPGGRETSSFFPLELFRRFATISSLANSFGGGLSPVALREPPGFAIAITLPVSENTAL